MKRPTSKTRPARSSSGAAYDNNLLCIGEKEVFAVERIFDALLEAVGRNGGYPPQSRRRSSS